MNKQQRGGTMKASVECMICGIKQVMKVSKLLGKTEEETQSVVKKTLKMLSEVEFDVSNPYISAKNWDIITSTYGIEDPYYDVKKLYNDLLISVYDETLALLDNVDDRFTSALKMAVIGNLIDMGGRHTFTKEMVLEKIKEHANIFFRIDKSSVLKQQLINAKKLFYIGDNCGEVVLDKLFITEIKRLNPDIQVTFGVRGGPVLNDVTYEDAVYVGIDKVADIVSSGIKAPGTLLDLSTPEFQNTFRNADVIIAKGQGNFESLSDTYQDNLFLIFIAKCDLVANTVGIDMMDIVVHQNNKAGY